MEIGNETRDKLGQICLVFFQFIQPPASKRKQPPLKLSNTSEGIRGGIVSRPVLYKILCHYGSETLDFLITREETRYFLPL